MKLKTLEPLRQRINISYTFTGFNETEVREYCESRLRTVNCRTDIFTEESYHTLYTMMNSSLRILNQLINKSMIIAMRRNRSVIDTEIIMEASRELMLG